jgi:heat shock protein HslJ
MILHRTPAALSAIAAAALLAACSSAPAEPPHAMPATHAPAHAGASLQSHFWRLAAAFNAQGAPDHSWHLAGRAPLQLQFERGHVAVQGLCNTLGASYADAGGQLRMGPAISTKRACPDADLMRLEDRVGAALPQVQRYRLQPAAGTPRLVLFLTDGSRWELDGAPTPQTRYGSAGERVFLEVAPQQVACSSGVMPNAQCLRVREVRYADNGVKQSVGQWQVFHGRIEGYTHEAGLRNVLRIQRFKLSNPPADAPAFAYVLDMVVETERMR